MQNTKPKKGDPVEIPVPKRAQKTIDALLKKAAQPLATRSAGKRGGQDS